MMDYLARHPSSYQHVHDDLGERPLLPRPKSEAHSMSSTLYDGGGYADNGDTKKSSSIVELESIRTNATERGSHDLFCEVIGKMPSSPGYSPSSATSSAGGLKTVLTHPSSLDDRSLYPRVLHAYHQQRVKHRLLSLSTTIVLWLQLIDGAVCAGLGSMMMNGSNHLSVVVIVLGSLQAVFAGVLAWFNARDQPERARQYRNGLKRVLDAIDDTEADFRMPGYAEGAQTVREKVQSIQDMYREIEKDMSTAVKSAVQK